MSGTSPMKTPLSPVKKNLIHKFNENLINLSDEKPSPRRTPQKKRRSSARQSLGSKLTSSATSTPSKKQRRMSSSAYPMRFSHPQEPLFSILPGDVWGAILADKTNLDLLGFKGCCHWTYNFFWENVQILSFPEKSWKPLCKGYQISECLSNCSKTSVRIIHMVTGALAPIKKLSTFTSLRRLEIEFTKSISYSAIQDLGRISSLQVLHCKVRGKEDLFCTPHKNMLYKCCEFQEGADPAKAKLILCGLMNLTHLKLTYSVLPALLPGLAALPALVYLDISFNTGHFSTQDLKYLGDLRNLTYLDLEGNYTVSPQGLPSALSTLTSLTSLNLSWMGWHTSSYPHQALLIPPQSFHNLINLKHLGLRGMEINLIEEIKEEEEEEEEEELKEEEGTWKKCFKASYNQLEVLDVSESALSDESLQEILLTFTNLKVLNISDCNLLTSSSTSTLLQFPLSNSLPQTNSPWTPWWKRKVTHPRGEHPTGSPYFPFTLPKY
eukprot:TRINITY_DN2595_c0_g1_i1.p1 TRINITY_DN2595_c0_g1~~TRINITY_DN2595_c0_g1_i1.p1  ORF type:complete len:521 (-),score=144.22 TRINITY_DN2595_c0_g1_i1:11-1495(-)